MSATLQVSVPAAAEEAAPEVFWGPGFAVLEGRSGIDGCLPRPVAQRVLRDLTLGANESLGIDPQITVLFSLDVPSCADIFYVPVANDVEGIGYEHFFDGGVFDFSPESRLEGIAFLNDAPYWESRGDELVRAFLHELGHRYAARVHVDGDEPLLLLGRDSEHWSFFLDTAPISEDFVPSASPLEGNSWLEEERSWQTATHEATSRFSALDLYLMGVLEPHHVPPLRVIAPRVTDDSVDCRGNLVQASSPPQTCGPLSVSGTSSIVTVHEVIAAEGPRVPPAVSPEASVALDVAFHFLVPRVGTAEFDACEHWTSEVQRLMSAFEEATGGRMVLRNVMADASAKSQGQGGEGSANTTEVNRLNCADFETPSSPAEAATLSGGGCAIAHRAQGVAPTFLLVLSSLALALRRRRLARTRRTVAGPCRSSRFSHVE